MRPYKLAGCAAFFILAAVSAGRGDDGLDPFSMAEDPRVSQFINQLSDPDPTARAVAVQKLIMLGETARPALRRALASATAETRPGIDKALLHVPWIKTGDSEGVENLFTGYAEQDAEARCLRIDGILASVDTAAAGALLRVILNDPSPAVRWEATNVLRLILDDNPAVARQIIDLSDGKSTAEDAYISPAENAPLLAVAGWAQRLTDPKRAAVLLSQSVRMEMEHPSAFRGQMDFAFLWLIDRANLLHDHAKAIELLRQQAARTPWNPDRVPDAVSGLFAAQAEFGPSREFADDLRSYREYLTHPEMIYALGQLARRQGHPHAADAIEALALVMGGTSSDTHYLVGSFLASHEWNAPAERELKLSIKFSGGKAINAYFQLSALADERDDDLASARYMETGLQKMSDTHGMVQTTRYGQVLPWSPDEAWAQVHWHYLRAARDSGDAAAAKTHLEKLLSLDQESHVLQQDPGMAADIVPALQADGRIELSDKIFDAAYESLQQKMLAEPQDPMPKNNLAWLCACSGKKLDEARQLSAQAVNQDPDNAACLDTQAECFMRSGQPARAVEIETHAVAIKPDDVYMQKQIARFRSAVANAKTRR
jgi:tetratricopeptide (TPR) repeat protein